MLDARIEDVVAQIEQQCREARIIYPMRAYCDSGHCSKETVSEGAVATLAPDGDLVVGARISELSGT